MRCFDILFNMINRQHYNTQIIGIGKRYSHNSHFISSALNAITEFVCKMLSWNNVFVWYKDIWVVYSNLCIQCLAPCVMIQRSLCVCVSFFQNNQCATNDIFLCEQFILSIQVNLPRNRFDIVFRRNDDNGNGDVMVSSSWWSSWWWCDGDGDDLSRHMEILLTSPTLQGIEPFRFRCCNWPPGISRLSIAARCTSDFLQRRRRGLGALKEWDHIV